MFLAISVQSDKHTHTHNSLYGVHRSNSRFTHTAFCDIGCQILFQDSPLALWGLQLYILLLQHWLQVRHLPLDKWDLLLNLETSTDKTSLSMIPIFYKTTALCSFGPGGRAGRPLSRVSANQSILCVPSILGQDTEPQIAPDGCADSIWMMCDRGRAAHRCTVWMCVPVLISLWGPF